MNIKQLLDELMGQVVDVEFEDGEEVMEIVDFFDFNGEVYAVLLPEGWDEETDEEATDGVIMKVDLQNPGALIPILEEQMYEAVERYNYLLAQLDAEEGEEE